MPVVAVNVSRECALALEQLVHLFKHYKNRSAAVRAALRLLFEQHKIKPDALREAAGIKGTVRDRRRPYRGGQQ